MSKADQKYEADTEANLNPARDSAEPKSDYSDHAFTIAWRKASYWWSSLVIMFAFIIVFYGIGEQWNNPPWDQGSTHPAFEVILMVLLLVWVAILEGAQVSIVGLQAIPLESFKHSHPRSYRCCKFVHAGANIERFIVGRQFLLLFIVFIVSRVGGAGVTPRENFYIGSWEWSNEATQFFWSNSVLLIGVIVVTQIVCQLLAAGKMLAFLELPYAPFYTVVVPSMIMEAIGLTHSAYALRDLFVKLSGTKDDGDQSKKQTKNFLYYIRVLLSFCAVVFSAVFVIKGLFSKQTNATNGIGWYKLPGWAAFIITVFFLFVIGCCEGFQIAAVALSRLPSSEFKTKAPVAYKTCQLLYAGRNMQAFLVGRQVFVAIMMVLLARVTSYAGAEGVLISGNDWGMSADFNKALLQSGLLGAIFVVNIGQLSFRMVASYFPVLFINNYVLHALLRIALLVEATGIVNAVWPLAWLMDAMLGLENDNFNTNEEVKTPADHIIDRKKSMGIPTQKGVSPYDLNQPESEFHMETTYKVSYI